MNQVNWYAAHAIVAVYLKEGEQRVFPVWENVILVSASSEEEAWKLAEELGRQAEGDCGGSFTLDGVPARREFVGIRRLMSIHLDGAERPGHGCEISDFL